MSTGKGYVSGVNYQGADKITGYAPNGLRWVEVRCKFCNTYIISEAVERGCMTRKCVNCKARYLDNVDRTGEVPDYEAYAEQERKKQPLPQR